MKDRLFLVLLALCLLCSGCRSGSDGHTPTDSHSFTDSLGREVTVSSLDRVAIASGSLAECWMLAGGSVGAVTRDAVTERHLDLPGDVIDLGSLKTPNTEVLLAHDFDLVMLVPSYPAHLSLAETLDKAGIPYAYFDVEDFADYLSLLKCFADMTGRRDLYEQNGTALTARIDAAIVKSTTENPPNILLLRTSSSNIKSLNSDTMVGQMLKELHCTNIADSDNGILTELSLEAIVAADPDYSVVVCMGEQAEAMAHFEHTLSSNPIWSTLSSVQNGRFHFLEKELFHYKPNARWGESYETLANLLTQN